MPTTVTLLTPRRRVRFPDLLIEPGVPAQVTNAQLKQLREMTDLEFDIEAGKGAASKQRRSDEPDQGDDNEQEEV